MKKKIEDPVVRFLLIEKGSAGELRSQLFGPKETAIISISDHEKLYNQCLDVSKQLSNFIKYLGKFEEEAMIN